LSKSIIELLSYNNCQQDTIYQLLQLCVISQSIRIAHIWQVSFTQRSPYIKARLRYSYKYLNRAREQNAQESLYSDFKDAV